MSKTNVVLYVVNYAPNSFRWHFAEPFTFSGSTSPGPAEFTINGQSPTAAIPLGAQDLGTGYLLANIGDPWLLTGPQTQIHPSIPAPQSGITT